MFIASDHAGFNLKEKVKNILEKLSIEYEDLGTYSDERTDYNIYAEKLAKRIQNENGKGILICKSGHGMVITANKFKGVYASIFNSPESVNLGVGDDNINVCVLSSLDISDDLMKLEKIILMFVNTKFKANDRYLKRFNELKEIEKREMK